METKLSRLLDALPEMVWTARPDGTCDFVNQRWREYTGLSLDEAVAAGWISLFHPEDTSAALETWARISAPGAPREIVIEARLRRFDGVFRRFRVQTRALRDAQDRLIGWCGTNTDVEDRRRAEAQLAAEKRLLERVARGMELSAMLDELCFEVEDLSPGSFCSILFVEDGEPRRFRIGAGPSLPPAYNAALEGLKIDPAYGPCSLAVERRTTVIAADPPRDARWASSPWPALVTGFGLLSCWSAPICGSQGDVLGIFAIYKATPHAPSPEDQELIDRFARIAGIAIERATSDAALEANAAKLRRANHYLAGAQRLSKTGSFTWDVATDAQDWSDELYRIWELDPAVPLSLQLLYGERMHPEDVTVIAPIVAKAVAAGESYEISYRIRTPSGALKHLRTVNDRFRDVTDRLVYIGATQDLTESKLAEEALKASEAKLRRANRYLTAAQALSRIGSFTWDVASDEMDWSDENFRIWGVAKGEKPAMSMILGAIHPDDLPAVAQTISEARASGEDFDVFYRIVGPDGALKHIHTVSTRIPEITDRVVYIGSNQDVTESKLAEAELARANAYLTAAQRLSQTGSFTWDVEADEHNWSDVIYRIFGFEPGAKVTTAMMLPAIHPEDLPQVEALLGTAVSGENFELVFRVLAADGQVRHAHVVGQRIQHIADRRVFMGALQDITARKVAETDLNRARSELAHVARVTALSALSASIAHEVSQPLAGILTNSSTCLRMLAADPPNIEGAVAAVQRTMRDGNRASEVIKRLRALFARKAPAFEAVDLNEAAREVLMLSASELQRRRVIVRTSLDDSLPPVSADRVQLQQVVLNLVLNAADAMAQGDHRARDLHVSTWLREDGAIQLDVRDSGPGIDPDSVEQLFEAFHTSKPEGMGIGLSISRSIIEAHRGRLWAAPNAPGPGATFTFSIPRAVEAAPAAAVRPAYGSA